MNKNTKPLKYIFENHFQQTWKEIKHKFPKNLHSSIWNNVSKFLDCGDISRGYTAFKCNQCSHIHAVFSLPTGFCRDFFFSHRFKLQDLAKAAYQSLKYVFKKSGIHSFGAIVNIHIFSRNLDWNPHIHCIFTYGGYKKMINGKNLNLFHTLRLKNLGKNVH